MSPRLARSSKGKVEGEKTQIFHPSPAIEEQAEQVSGEDKSVAMAKKGKNSPDMDNLFAVEETEA